MIPNKFYRLMTSLAVIGLFSCSAWADTQQEIAVAPGVHYKEIHCNSQDGKALAIYVLSVDRSAPNISFRAMKGHDSAIGTDRVTDMVKNTKVVNGEVIAAINADYFCMEDPYAGEPCGMMIRLGELMTSPSDGWPTFGFDKSGNPAFAMVSFDGRVNIGKESFGITKINRPRHSYDAADTLALYTPSLGTTTQGMETDTNVVISNLKPALPLRAGVTYTGTIVEVKKNAANCAVPKDSVLLCGSGNAAAFLDKQAKAGSRINFSIKLNPDWSRVRETTGCWPIFLHDGKAITCEGDPELILQRHARTAVGWNDKQIFFVNVDGNRRETGSGMTIAEISALMIELGCKEGACMDGGGSTTMVVRGRVMNHPSDRSGERSVSNGWAIISSQP